MSPQPDALVELLQMLVRAVERLDTTALEVVSELVKLQETIQDAAAAGRDDRPARTPR